MLGCKIVAPLCSVATVTIRQKSAKNGNLTDTIPIFALFFYFFETGRTETMPLPKR